MNVGMTGGDPRRLDRCRGCAGTRFQTERHHRRATLGKFPPGEDASPL